MIASIWTITWDPDGTPITLADTSAKLNIPPPMSVRQMVESSPIIEAETEHYPRDHREGLPWTLEVIEEHATLIAAEAFRETRLAAIDAILTTRKPIEVASTALSLTRRMADATFEACDIQLMTRGGPRTIASYIILGKPFAAYVAP